MCKSVFSSILLFLGTTLLLGCKQTVTSINEDRDVIFQDSNEFGYLLMAVDTSQTLQELHLSGESRLVLTTKDLRQGTNYILLSVEAGQYSIDKIQISSFLKVEFNEEYWTFNILPNHINYIGELYAHNIGWYDKHPRFALVNNSSFALEFMESHFSNILSSKKLIYGGPGDDDFFDVVNLAQTPEEL